MKITSRIGVFPFFLLSLLSIRATANTVDFGNINQVNRPHQISIKFDESPDKVRCGLSVDWGDGVSKEYRVGNGYDLQHPYRLEHTYTTAGTKKVAVKGVFLIRGLGSVAACNVKATGEVSVDDPVERERALQLAADEAKKAAELKLMAEQARLYREHVAALASNTKSEVPSEANAREAADAAAKKEAETRDKPAQPSPDFLKQQAEAEKKRLVEEQAAAAREKKEKAEALAREKIEAQAAAAKEKKEKAEALARERIEAREAAAREKKEKAEALAQEKLDEKQRLREEKEQLAREKIEREEAEKLRIFKEKADLQQRLRENARQALIRPLITWQDPRLECQARVEIDPQFSQLKTKTSLSGLTDLSFPMLANQAFPNAKEQQLIALLADEFKKCINQGTSFRFSTYSKEQNFILEREDAALLEALIELYSKKINFSSYNIRIQQIARDSKSALSTLEQKIQSEKLAKEQETKRREQEARTREQEARNRATQLRQAQAEQEQRVRDAELRALEARMAANAREEEITRRREESERAAARQRESDAARQRLWDLAFPKPAPTVTCQTYKINGGSQTVCQ